MKDIWRDKKGRFANYWSIVNGPFLPPGHPILREHMQRQMNRLRSELLQSYMSPSAIYKAVNRAQSSPQSPEVTTTP